MSTHDRGPLDRGPLINQDELGPPPEGVNLPTVEARTWPLTDDDASVCRTIDESELAAYYVDYNIAQIAPLQGDPWSKEASVVDNQDLRITYTDGRQFSIRLGLISLGSGPALAEFRKQGGIIFATDASGNGLFDATNTPQLAFIRNYFHEVLRQQSEQILEIATIVYLFSQAVAAAGQSVNSVRF